MPFHDPRHSAATLALQAGAKPLGVAEWIGHSSIKVTLGLYGHVTDSMQEEVSKAMQSPLTGAAGPVIRERRQAAAARARRASASAASAAP